MSQTIVGRGAHLSKVLPLVDDSPAAAAHVVRVMLVDSNEVVRAGVKSVVGGEADIEVVAAVGSVEEAQCHLAHAAPDVVLISDRPGEQGPRFCRDVIAQRASVTVVVLASQPAPATVAAYLEAGARAFLARGITAHELAPAIRAAARNVCILAPEPAEAVIEWARRTIAAERTANLVSPDETQVIAALAEGLSNRAIATRLGITEQLVKSRVTSATRKLGARRRAGLVGAAIRAGIISGRSAVVQAPGQTRRVAMPADAVAGEDPQTIRVVVVDDRNVVRRGITVLLEDCEEIDVVGAETSLAGVLAAVESAEPDVVVVDLHRSNGIEELGRALAERRASAAVIGLCARYDESVVRTALQAGVRACLIGELDVTQLDRAIRIVSTRTNVRACSGLVDWSTLPAKGQADSLSPSERKVLESLVRGFTNREIAAATAMSSHNVKRIVKQLYAKMGVRTRAEAVAVGLRERVLR